MSGSARLAVPVVGGVGQAGQAFVLEGAGIAVASELEVGERASFA